MTCVYSVDLLNKHFVHRGIAKKHCGQKCQILSRNYDTFLPSTKVTKVEIKFHYNRQNSRIFSGIFYRTCFVFEFSHQKKEQTLEV